MSRNVILIDQARKAHHSRQIAGGKIAIYSREGALKWGDGWKDAYTALYQARHWEIRELQDELLFAQVDLTIERGERLLERIAFEDEIKRLRGMIE